MLTSNQQHIVLNYMNLARKLAARKKKSVGRHIELDDLTSAAYFGLSDAASRHDGERPFGPYASIRISGAIQDYLRGLGIGKRGDNSEGCKPLGQFAVDANGRSAEDSLESQRTTDFDEITEGLPPLGRDLLRLYYVDGLKLKQIGERIGVGEARVSQLLSQYRDLIRSEAA